MVFILIIEIKDKALEQIKKHHMQQDEGIRISTEQELSCSLFTDYTMTLIANRMVMRLYTAKTFRSSFQKKQ